MNWLKFSFLRIFNVLFSCCWSSWQCGSNKRFSYFNIIVDYMGSCSKSGYLYCESYLIKVFDHINKKYLNIFLSDHYYSSNYFCWWNRIWNRGYKQYYYWFGSEHGVLDKDSCCSRRHYRKPSSIISIYR